ncbi:hydrolase [Burkholderia sp. PAMC 28687]|jgi:pimeloyl-ACP methyl ester carboxylesterase|uniref:alpha/beta fold hydrolase n=1 Tax=Burkholderia sp. PAMC 28687 TaxID=1795874 RepID=UPI0007829275|nr:alpha/beta hydrolase [Burkholderia sp. PAMC 28687]AMM15665.1 hydrolase [Burkholderia sp. PAMC 28687]
MSAWILLRGLTREGRHWGKFLEHLRLEAALPGDQVTLLDLPGNGRESALAAHLNVSDMTIFVRSRAAAAGLKPPYRLLAMSLGGMVATDWAQRYPEDIERLVLINTSMRPFAAMQERLQLAAWPQLLRAAALWNDPLRCEGIIHGVTCNRTDTFDDDLAVWTTIRRVAPVSAENALRQLWAAARFRAGEQAPACPTLLLSSKMDHLVKAVCSERIAKQWHAEHKQHAWAGHDLPHDDPLWTADAIAGWLKTLR